MSMTFDEIVSRNFDYVINLALYHLLKRYEYLGRRKGRLDIYRNLPKLIIDCVYYQFPCLTSD